MNIASSEGYSNKPKYYYIVKTPNGYQGRSAFARANSVECDITECLKHVHWICDVKEQIAFKTWLKRSLGKSLPNEYKLFQFPSSAVPF